MSYTTKFAMPIIEPPASGTYPTTNIQVTSVTDNGLKITLSDPTYRKLFAITGGNLTFIPDSDPTRPGAIEVQTHPLDLIKLKKPSPEGLPPGVPPMISVVYFNVNANSVRVAMEPMVRALSRAPLERYWNNPTKPKTSATKTELEENYLNRLINGETFVTIVGGTLIAEAEHRDPGDTTSDIEFTLYFTDGAGNNLSPVLHLRSIPNYGGTEWRDHPLISAITSIAVPVNFWLKFEVWNENTNTHVPLPQGVDVMLMDYDLMSPNDLLGTPVQTDSQGITHFQIPDLQTIESEPDIFFLVQTNGIQISPPTGPTLPDEWSTKGWTAADGSPGYYENFTGTQLGDQNNPLVFRIGLDFHIKCQYIDNSGHYMSFPKGIPVTLCAGFNPIDYEKRQIRTDENGEVHGVLFDVEGEDSIYFKTKFEMEETNINLPKAKVEIQEWVSWEWDDDRQIEVDNINTSIGSISNPYILDCGNEGRNVAVHFLKVLRELSIFLYHLTDGDWLGVSDLTFYRTSLSNWPYSWPVGHVNMPPSHQWSRKTLVHEISHQIMWKEVNYTSLGIAYEAIIGDLSLYHRADLLDNPEHALIEGWAEFFEAVFGGITDPPYNVTTLIDASGNIQALGPPPNNRGEMVEGAFANGLWAVFKNHVVTPGVSMNAHVATSVNGDVTSTSPWIQDASVKQRFQDIIWEPLKALRLMSNPTSTAMIEKIRSKNMAMWHVLSADLQTFNMAMGGPTVTAISPSNGPTTGGQTVTITGTNFVIGTQVTIGGAQATSIAVISATSLNAVTPAGVVGSADVEVSTVAGGGRLSNGYTYA